MKEKQTQNKTKLHLYQYSFKSLTWLLCSSTVNGSNHILDRSLYQIFHHIVCILGKSSSLLMLLVSFTYTIFTTEYFHSTSCSFLLLQCVAVRLLFQRWKYNISHTKLRSYSLSKLKWTPVHFSIFTMFYAHPYCIIEWQELSVWFFVFFDYFPKLSIPAGMPFCNDNITTFYCLLFLLVVSVFYAPVLGEKPDIDTVYLAMVLTSFCVLFCWKWFPFSSDPLNIVLLPLWPWDSYCSLLYLIYFAVIFLLLRGKILEVNFHISWSFPKA